jgi:uncharacterized protein YutE (UPF0331/DUF86 family)
MSPGFVSRVVVADKIAAVQRMLDGIRTLPLDNLAAFTADGRMVAAGDSYLRRALEALLDLARHVLAKGFGRAPAEYGEVARQLGEGGVVDAELAARLTLMARYRNRIVHFYDEITDQEGSFATSICNDTVITICSIHSERGGIAHGCCRAGRGQARHPEYPH